MRAGNRAGIAVSGGADSVALLRILLELRDELGVVISVVHFNHKIRGAESEADEVFVRELALQHELIFFGESGDAKAHAANTKLSLETAARELRYEFFNRLLASGEVNRIATAHTLDDQSETVLLKLTRGAGTRGLAGIFPKLSMQQSALSSQQSTIVRPLLGTRRPEVEAYLQENGQAWREDASNRDLQHTRNRIRREVLPQMEETLNQRVRETLAEAAEIARAEEEFWAEHVAAILARGCTKDKQSGKLSLDLLREVPLAVQRRLVRSAAESVGLHLEFCHVEEIIGLAHEGARAALPHNWMASLYKGEIRFAAFAETVADYSYVVPVPGRIELGEVGIVIEASFSDGNGALAPTESLLRPELAQGQLVIRNWRAGDRFFPAHGKQPKKIKELLQDLHITGTEKKSWPVMTNGDEVIWVRRLGVGRNFLAEDGAGVLIRERALDEASGGQG